MMRIVLAAWFSFLLLGLQHESLVHAYQHDRARLADGGKAVAQTSANGLCITCVLISGGSHAVGSASTSMAKVVQPSVLVATPRSSHHTLAPVYYASRAPPVLSL